MTIDEMTRMDSTSYTGGDNTFTYYTLTGAADDPEHSGNPLKNIWRKIYRESSKTQMIKMYRYGCNHGICLSVG